MKRVRYAIGLDMGGTNIRCGAVSFEGKVLLAQRGPSRADRGAGEVAANIVRALQTMEEAARGRGLGAPTAIGVAVPGPLDLVKGTVMTAPHVSSWRVFPLRKVLEREMQRRVTIENDCNACILGESWRGAARGAKNAVLVNLGTGVGGGLIVDGKVVHGRTGLAGELGHVMVEPEGIRCDCGSNGCLEAYASASGLRRQIEQQLGVGEGGPLPSEFLDAEGVFTVRRLAWAARRGNLLARSVLETAGHYLGIAIGSFLNVFNPELILIGGGVSGALPFMRRAMLTEARRRSFAASFAQARIVRAALGERAGVLGSGYAAMRDGK